MSGTHAVAGFSLSPLPGLTLEPEASAGKVAWNDSGEGLLGVAAGKFNVLQLLQSCCFCKRDAIEKF